MNTLFPSTKLCQITIALTFFTASDKSDTTGITTKLTTGTQPGVADGAYLQMGSAYSPNLKM